MQTLIERPALRVLTPTLAHRLRTFNEAARALRRAGARLNRFDPVDGRLGIAPEDGQRLLRLGMVNDVERVATAGSTQYRAQFMGITLEWREAISYARPEEWAANPTH